MECLRCPKCGSSLGPGCGCYVDKFNNQVTPDGVRTHIDFGLNTRTVTFPEYKRKFDNIDKLYDSLKKKSIFDK